MVIRPEWEIAPTNTFFEQFAKEHFPDVRAYFKDAGFGIDYQQYYSDKPLEVILRREKDNINHVTISIGNRHINLINFELSAYPSCCAMFQFINFYHHPKVSQELINKLLDLVFSEVKLGTWFENRRLVVAMVESRGLDGDRALITTDFQEIENPTIKYRGFYDYFKTKKFKLMNLMYNVNTGALIHLIEVIV